MRLMRKQDGAAILVVMLILLVITVLGITAVRMGMTSLTIATNSQVSALLFQAADTGLASFEGNITANPAKAANADGVIGGAAAVAGTDTKYCVTKDNLFRAGGCAAGVDADFNSARKVVLNQVAVMVPANEDGSPQQPLLIGTDPERSGGLVGYKVNIYSTSVLPVIGAASETEINGCLGLPNSDPDDNPAAVTTVTDCLTDAGAVFTTMVQEYDYNF